MLKKVIVGILCLIILAFTGVGIYIYTLDWNKHRSTVSQRLSQITGLNASIEGNLTIDFLPTPKVTAGQVKFYKPGTSIDPLIMINEVRANLEFMPLLDNKFVITSMQLNDAMVNIIVNEKGEVNWSNVKNNGISKSGNIEASFSDVKLINSTIHYENLVNKKEFKIPNISVSVSAPSLAGPYNTNGQFIHNGAEIKFNGNVINDDKTKINMVINNPSTSSRINIEGTVGAEAEGIFTLDTANLYELSNIVFGKDSINSIYNSPSYFSFKYKNIGDSYTFDNFTIKYGDNTVGTGNVSLQLSENKKLITSDFDMKKFDLDIIKNICNDYIDFIKKGEKLAYSDYSGELSIKAKDSLLNGVGAQDLSLALSVSDGFVSIERFGINLPGDSSVKMVGKVNLDTLQYASNQYIKTSDLRVLASVFGIDLAKLATDENKKSIFNNASADIEISGDLNNFKFTIPNAEIDAMKFSGNIGYVVREDKDLLVLDINASKIIFDKYVDVMPKGMVDASLKDKFIYQVKLIPHTDKVDIDASINIENAVYNKIPLEKVALQLMIKDDSLAVKKLDIENIANANLSLSLDASKIYDEPYFNELSYNLKSSDFPLFVSTLGIKTSDKLLFNNKLVASQGVLNGTFGDYKLSLLQKFGDTEFSYNGDVKKNEQNNYVVNGELELKTNNFAKFVKSIGLDYNPNIALTSFNINGKLNGGKDNFELSDINAYLGANNITGALKYSINKDKPTIIADLSLESFEVNRWFNVDTKFANYTNDKIVNFIKKPVFISEEINYSKLNTVNFDIKAKASKVFYNNEIYSNANISTTLSDGVLTVNSFNTNKDNTDIMLDFVLDSNNLPKISGNYNLKNIKTPELGGNVYSISKSNLVTKGKFSSSALSKKDFFDNLVAEGEFKISDTIIKGLDLDVIKFDLEQRKTVKGLENKIENSLKSGRSAFDSISGNYSIHKGVVLADNVIMSSPVANIDMDINFNINDWLFSANFDTLYHNASFYDIVKFTLDGELENPNISININDSLKRIGDAENRVKMAFANEEKEKYDRISNKLSSLNNNINKALSNISRISLDVVRYTPISSNEDVKSTFDSNVKILHDTENSIKNMALRLSKKPSEEILMNIESEFWSEEAKLKFISKTLEDNFIVDSKYVFDDIFNKITWLYNVAQNNVAYYNTVSSAYADMSTELEDNEIIDKLSQSSATVKDDINKINDLQEKIRDNYLHIIDSSKVSEMNSNIDVAKQALQTILTYTKQLNDDIITSIDLFRSNLHINERNYDEFLVYPPDFIGDIDIKEPTFKNKGDPLEGILTPAIPQEEEKKTSFNFGNIKNGLGSLISKFNADKLDKKERLLVSSMSFTGLSDLINKQVANSEQNSTIDLNIAIADISNSIDFPQDSMVASADIIETLSNSEIKINSIDAINKSKNNSDKTSETDKITENDNIKSTADTSNASVITEVKKEIPTVNRDEIPSIVKSLETPKENFFIANITPFSTNESYYNNLDDSNYNTKSLINSFDKNTTLNLAENDNLKVNRYLFSNNKNTFVKTHGNIGKSMLKSKIVNSNETKKANRYIFASNDLTSGYFTGTISKLSSLTVK